MKTALSFLAMAVLAAVLWRILRRQEQSDPDFERRLEALQVLGQRCGDLACAQRQFCHGRSFS